MITYGIMQGRLVPSKGRGIQFFPFDNWKEEFDKASTLSLDEIEWIFDYEQYKGNPLWTQSGANEIKKVINQTGVIVKSVCFDYFMRRAFYRNFDDQAKTYQENIEFIQKIMNNMNIIGASILEIPIVDSSSIQNEDELKKLTYFLNDVIIEAEKRGIKIGLETDFVPGVFSNYIEKFQGRIGANYDSGNSSGLGYDAEEEILSLKGNIINVHIKDRVFQGTTVELGKGSADFKKVFSSLSKINYNKSFIIQAARGIDGCEEETIKQQLKFIKNNIEKYYS